MKKHIVYLIFISLFTSFDFCFPVQCKYQTKTLCSSNSFIVYCIKNVNMQQFLSKYILQDLTKLIALLGKSITEYHRIVGVGRDLCGSSSPTPVPKQGHLQ